MQEDLQTKEQEIKELERQKRDVVPGDHGMRKVMDGMIMEIARLKETIKILEQSLSKHKISEAMGYF